jgi:hypothetical protein
MGWALFTAVEPQACVHWHGVAYHTLILVNLPLGQFLINGKNEGQQEWSEK